MPELQIPEKLLPLFEKPKRIKIAVGGRGGAKSDTFSQGWAMFAAHGEKLCCGREFQNTIDDSVHSLIKSKIYTLDIGGFSITDTRIEHQSGGEIFYKGLARNIESLKSTHGIKRLWVEEAQSLSQKTIDILGPTIREPGSEIWFSLNRGSRTDPFSQTYLVPYEKHLERDGYYEDDEIMIVEINYYDNPWFPAVLEQQRILDGKNLSRQKYDHIWNGAYNDEVDNALISPEWFDACVDAHEKLGFKPQGMQTLAHDPSDEGGDDKGLAYRYGSVILDARTMSTGNIHDGGDWAAEHAIDLRVDMFVWDGDGMGVGLRRQVDAALKGKRIEYAMFRGSEAVDYPDAPFDGSALDSEHKSKTNKDTFKNKRAQYYWELRNRCWRTYEAVEHGRYYDPDTLISFSSKIKDLKQLRAELCRIPLKPNQNVIQILSKPEMRRLEIPSPNLADSVMMSMYVPRGYFQDVDEDDEWDNNIGRSETGGY